MDDLARALSARLTTLEAQLAQQQSALQAQQTEIVSLRRRAARRRSATLARALAIVVVVALLATPLAALAANFTDLNPGSTHNANINAIADAGISKGCTDAQHYCPNEVVTRDQMASFLARTAGLGGNPPVANALTAVTAQTATTATNATQLGGVPASGYQRTYVRTVIVSPVGTEVENGAALRTALGGIAGASDTNRFLVKIEPGTYDVTVGDALDLPSFVDIEGAGQGVTVILRTTNAATNAGDKTELRQLTFRQTDGGAVNIPNGRTARFSHVTVDISDANAGAFAVTITGGATLAVEASTIRATGTSPVGGIHFSGGGTPTLTVRESTVSGTGTSNSRGIGIVGVGNATVTIEHSRISGTNNAIVTLAGSTYRIANSQLGVGPITGAGTVTCAGVYDENFVFSAGPACP